MSTDRSGGVNTSADRLCRWPYKPKDLLKGAIKYNLKYFGSCAVESDIHDHDVIKRIVGNLCEEFMNSKRRSLKVKQLADVQLVLTKNTVEIHTRNCRVPHVTTIPLTDVEFCDTEKLTNNETHSFLVFVVNVAGRCVAYVCVCQNDLARLIKLTLGQMFDLWGLNEKREVIRKVTTNDFDRDSNYLLVNAIRHQFGKIRARTEVKTRTIVQAAKTMLTSLEECNTTENSELINQVEQTKTLLSLILCNVAEVQDELETFENNMTGSQLTIARSRPPSDPTDVDVYETPRQLASLILTDPSTPSVPTTPVPAPPTSLVCSPGGSSDRSSHESTSPVLTSTSPISLVSPPHFRKNSRSPGPRVKHRGADKERAAEILRQRREKMEKQIRRSDERENKPGVMSSVGEEEETTYYGHQSASQSEAADSSFMKITNGYPKSPCSLPEEPSTSGFQLPHELLNRNSTTSDDTQIYSDDSVLKVGRVPNDEGEKIYEELHVDESVYIVRD